MIAKLKTQISMAVSSLHNAVWFGTTCHSHRRIKRNVLPLVVAFAIMAAQPLAAQEKATVDPAGVVSWDELVAFQQLNPTYGKQPRVVPFMPGPEPRSWGEPADTVLSTAPSMEDFVGEEPEPLIPIADDFEALPDNNTSIPPDTMGAAGPSHLVTMLNTEVRIQDKSGGNISTVTLDTFWTGGTGLSGNPFDPKIIFDQLSDRWLATVVADSRSADSAVWFAVSTTDDPTQAWTFYAIDADAGNTTWADYPGFGVNSKWVAITNNMFLNAGGFVGAKMWVIDKSTFGGALGFTTFPTGFDLAGGADGFTLKPAVTFDPGESNLYIVDNSGFFITASGIHLLRLSRITGTANNPSWSVVSGGPFPGTGFFAVANDFNYTQIDASQPGTATRVETNDPRLLNAVCRNGHLWTTHSAGLPRAGSDRTAVFWYEIDPTANLNDPIVQSGVLDGGADVHHFFPSIAANSTDDVALGFSRSDSTTFVEGVLTGRRSGDPAGSMDAIQVIKAGEATYVKTFGGTSNRWGDYSATVVDPADDSTFWSIQQYAATPPGDGFDRWGTWWATTGAAAPPDVDPIAGTIGTVVDITNLSNLGTKAPKVLIGDPLIGQTKCKVETFTTSSVSCLIKKVKSTMPPGTYDVTIQRKGKPFKGVPPTVLTNAFSIMAPSITAITPNSGLPREQVTITGSFFGTKKVKAFWDDGIKAKKGKVVSLTMDDNTGASTLEILVPKKLAPGLYDVTVTNKVGEDTLVGGFTIQ